MDGSFEARILVGDLIARCMDMGMSKSELMKIITGHAGDVSTLLNDVEASEVIETRVRHLHEIIRLARNICGAEAEPWLRSDNGALGQRSPIDTLLEFPGALAGMMHLMRRLGSDGDSIH
jgi:uncharacterized protein (DUF2384 family)